MIQSGKFQTGNDNNKEEEACNIQTCPNSGDVKLFVTDENTPNEGLLQLYNNGRWGTICADDGFNTYNLGEVVCTNILKMGPLVSSVPYSKSDYVNAGLRINRIFSTTSTILNFYKEINDEIFIVRTFRVPRCT